MLEVDARGLSCPVPVVRTKQALDKGPDKCIILVDAYAQVESVTRLARSKDYRVSVEEEGDSYRITIEKESAGA